jgi:hypothetical protein
VQQFRVDIGAARTDEGIIVSVTDDMGIGVDADDERRAPGVDLAEFRRLSMVALYAQGQPVGRIAQTFGVHRVTVWREVRKVDPEAGRRVMQAG